MKKNERLQALHSLTCLLEKKTPLLHVMQSRDLSPFSKELCFGVCRNFYRLESIADRLIKKRPKQLDIWLCVLMGLYQLYYLKLPDYAVVKESVTLLTSIKKIWAKGLVNAVLRTFCREQDAILERLRHNQTFVYGHPDWLLERIQHNYPNQWPVILQANDTHPPMTLRVNQQKTTRTTYLDRLKQLGIEGTPHPWAEQGIVLSNAYSVTNLPGFSQGDVSVQDAAAQLTVSLLNLKPDLRVLDACCAPGGKTCHILETQPNLKTLWALDIEPKRLARVQENLQRLNLNATLVQGDGLTPNTWWDGQLFDRILLDAPCSATGVIRRHPDIKLLRTEAEIQTIVTTQHDLLHALWPLLAPGGRMVYATCSIMPEENTTQIAQFAASKPDCTVVMEDQSWGHKTTNGIQILPGDDDMDGFFYCTLHKTENSSNISTSGSLSGCLSGCFSFSSSSS